MTADGSEFSMRGPRADEIGVFGEALVAWERWDGLATGLRSGDFGWLCRNGDDWVTENFRIWVDAAGRVVAGGLLEDGLGIWLQLDPARLFDVELARAIADGVQKAGITAVSGPAAPSAVRGELVRRGAVIDPKPWPHLWRPLTDADLIEIPGVVSTSRDALIDERIAVQRAAFARSTFTREKWDTMASGPLFRPELDLVALDDQGKGVSALTAWLSRPGACGVIEPMGTHRDHWRQGHGTRVLTASFAALRRMGATGVRVGVERANTTALATYTSVGFRMVGYDTTLLLP